MGTAPQGVERFELMFLGTVADDNETRHRVENILNELYDLCGDDLDRIFASAPLVIRRTGDYGALQLQCDSLRRAGAQVDIVENTPFQESRTKETLPGNGATFQDGVEVTADMFYAGTACMRDNRHQDAISIFSRALTIQPDFAEVHLNLGNVYFNVNNRALAAKHYKEYIRLKPEKPEGYSNLGNLCMKENDFSTAIENYEKTLQRQPTNAYVQMTLGFAYQNLNRLVEAQTQYERCLDLDPTNEAARRLLGDVMKMIANGGGVQSSLQLAIPLGSAVEEQVLRTQRWAEHMGEFAWFHNSAESDAGEPLTPHNIPSDWNDQMRTILKELRKAGCCHNAISPQTVRVRNGVLLLCDFRWATRIDQIIPESWPDEVGGEFRLGIRDFDDDFSFRRTIASLKPRPA